MIIDKRGCVIEKHMHKASFLKSIRETLTVKPIVNPDYVMGKIPVYSVFSEDEKCLYVPRFFGKQLNLPFEEEFSILTTSSYLNSTVVLRDYQKPVVDAALDRLKKLGGGILACGTGTGKTSMAIHIACTLKFKTLIIVHKSFLLEQWKSRIEQFVPFARIGRIQGPTVDIDDKDIVIGMLQSLATKTYDSNTFDSFGMVIADEAHHLSAEVFCRALPKVASRYMLGLSATPQRKDGLTKVFKWYLGDIAYNLKSTICDSVFVVTVKFACDDPDYGKEKKNFKGNILLPRMISDLVDCDARNNIIIEVLKFYVHEERQIMVISDRLLHLETLKRKFDETGTRREDGSEISTGFYTGRQKQQELEKNEKKNVIFSTYSLVREGLDIPSLNTLIFATPVSDVVQASGRILRKEHTCNPLIIDIIDQYSIFFAQSKKRKSFYNKSGFTVFEKSSAEKPLSLCSTLSMQDFLQNHRIEIDDTHLENGNSNDDVDSDISDNGSATYLSESD